MNKQAYKTHVLGFPRVGEDRELKWALEKFWRNEITEKQLQHTASELREINWKLQKKSGLDFVSVNDFSFYDQVLDTACCFGIIPERYDWDRSEISLDLYF